jgi:Lrp/AsnC family transcriptional regulator for asnA, asnC and gidA
MKPIDEIDTAILKNLFEDGRKNFTLIAEECHVSKDIIWKHYMRMKRAGIIVGATIEFNYPRFGYNAVANLLLNVESQYIDEVFEYLRNIPDVETCRQYNSQYNIITVSKLRSLRDLERIKEVVNKKSLINEIKTLLWIDVKNLPENILRSTFENETAKVDQKSSQADPGACSSAMKLDEIDLQIVEKLTKNGRAPFRKIAQEMGISTGTVARRYQKLLENKFIKVTIQINPAKLGYKALVTFLIEITNHDKIRDIVEKLSKIPRVSYIATLAGAYDLRVVALVKDLKEIFTINEEIEKVPFIKRIETSLRSPRLWPVPHQYISTL